MTDPAVRRAYSSGRFGQIHYRIAGPGGTRSPLLLLHPSPLSSLVFEGFMKEIGRDHTVIAPDTPGFGLSDPPPTTPEIGDYAGAMLDLLDTMGFGLTDVMGYHTGSLTAVEMARQRPEVVRRLVMISAPIFTPDELTDFRARYAPKSIDARLQHMTERWPIFRKEAWNMEPDDAQRWNIFLDGQRNPEILAWGHRAAFNYPLADVLPKITHPILVLNPDDDLKTQTPRAQKLLKNGRIHNLPGWNHGFLTAKAFETANIVREFLS